MSDQGGDEDSGGSSDSHDEASVERSAGKDGRALRRDLRSERTAVDSAEAVADGEKVLMPLYSIRSKRQFYERLRCDSFGGSWI